MTYRSSFHSKITPSATECNLELGHHEARGRYFDYSPRAQWLRAVVLGGNEGLVSTTLLVMGVGMLVHDTKTLFLRGLVGLVAGALSIATGEVVSIYTQVDIIKSQIKRDMRMGRGGMVAVPIPSQIAVAASMAYLMGGSVPLLAAGAINDQKLRFLVAVVTAGLSMFVFGVIGAALGKAPIARSCARVLVGGFIEIMIVLGKTKVIESYGLQRE
ncbi:hypothetical protein F0562_014289 [Nyssa sinensis]|uniref:Vacuolar iron transporter n=1 Tax=Nyssa sinensis TaxID=561372 RepID=A0A5J4ZSB1_9ASTE|nr:hypothetical protein F0562_014289 [Nyssa sinensis]